MKTAKFITILTFLLISGNALADEIVDGCAKALMGGQICPIDPNGTVVIDVVGSAKCAPGKCVIDSMGNAICSSRSGGRVVLGTLNTPTCQGSCMRPTRDQCEKLGN